MARTFTELVSIFNGEWNTQRLAEGLPVDDPNTWKKVSRKRFFRNIQCLLALTSETIFELFTTDVTAKLRELKPHTQRWYANKTLAYQHGFNLLPDSDEYDNTGYNDADIEAAKIVKYAAVVEQQNQYARVFLRIKLAGETAGDLAALTTPQVDGVKAYLARIKDAGIKLQVESLPADRAKMRWTIYYDPLILDAAGNRLDGTASDVVRVAIKEYFKNLPFNGIYVLEYHIDFLQLVDGVTIAIINEAQTKYGLLAYSNVQVKVTPDSGYLRFYDDADLVTDFIAQAPIR
jgi:hypothetical protein